jgi:Rrf2 family cysteine metabolism transcriptional repressor
LTPETPRKYTPLRLTGADWEGKVRGPGANLKTQYALQAVIHLARQEDHRVVSASEMAAVLSIAPKFLEDILGALRSAGIVQSRRGKEGGYALVLLPAELTVLDVVQAMEGPDVVAGRATESPLSQVAAWIFERAREAAALLLAETTIEQLAAEARLREAERETGYMYHL